MKITKLFRAAAGGRRRAAGALVQAAVVASVGAVAAGTASAAAPASASARTVSAAPAVQSSPAVRAACPPVRAGYARCLVAYATRPGVSAASGLRAALVETAPSGWGAKDIEAAYKLPVSRGARQTVALVDAYHTPDLASYLATYRKEYGLPACTAASGCFREVNQAGKGSPMPHSSAGTGWDMETTLDVDMVSAACPHCKILVVEADSAGLADLGAAENTAASLGAQVISNSYGARENGYAMKATGAYHHPGHVIVASSGDYGFTAANFPADLTTVTAVGGTELARAKNKRGWSETVWNDGEASGSGCSAYVAKPSWQHDSDCSMRTVGDVSALAWNIAIYEGHDGGWLTVGGTSAAAPLVAGVYALAGNAGMIRPGYEYAHARSLFDVTTGNNNLLGTGGGAICGYDDLCTAQKGYDAPTGLGTPDGTAAF